MPILKVSVAPKDFEKYIFGDIPDRIFRKLVRVETAGSAVDPEEGPYTATETERDRSPRWGVKPELETYLLDEAGYVQARPL